jgi:hypothetical protein
MPGIVVPGHHLWFAAKVYENSRQNSIAASSLLTNQVNKFCMIILKDEAFGLFLFICSK